MRCTKKALGWVLCSLVFGALICIAYAAGSCRAAEVSTGLSPEQTRAFQAIQTLRLVVDEQYEGRKGLSNAVVREIASLMLQEAGVKVVEAPTDVPDATLTVTLRGTLSKSTGEVAGEGFLRASVEGNVSLSADSQTYAHRFTNVEHTYHGFPAGQMDYADRAFKDSLWETDLLEALVEAVSLVRDTGQSRLLIACVRCGNPGAINRAKGLLTRSGGVAVEPLLKALNDEDFGVQSAAADVLGDIGDPRAVEPLIAALENERLTGAAAEALGKIRDRRAVASLRRIVLHGENGLTRNQAAEALTRIPDDTVIAPLVEALTEGDRDLREAAAGVLIGYLDAPSSMKRVTDDFAGDFQEMRRHAALFGVHLPPSEAEWKALEAEMAAQKAAVQGALTAALRKTLAENKSARATALLFGALRHSSDFDWNSLEASKIGRHAVEPLIVALGDRDAEVRAGAVVVLGKIGDPAAVEAVIPLLRDRDAGVRVRAARALADMNDARAVGPLIGALKKTDIPDAGYRCGLQADPEWEPAAQAAWALGKIGDRRAVAPLITALKQGDDHFQARVVEALGRIGDSKALAPLRQLAEDDTNWLVQEEAKKAIEAIREKNR